MPGIHYDVYGRGRPAIFLHGSFGWGVDTFPEQRTLADLVRVVLIDRRGFGQSRDNQSDGWPADQNDLLDVLTRIGPAHLVGQSYGAVVTLLAAAARPELVLSLVTIEPPMFALATDDNDSRRIAEEAAQVYARAPGMKVDEFVAAFGAAVFGREPAATRERTAAWADMDWAAADATRRERWPGDAPVDWSQLRDARFPKLSVGGGWPTGSGYPHRVGRAFRAVVERVAERTAGEVVVFDRSTHNPQLEQSKEFNEMLRRLYAT